MECMKDNFLSKVIDSPARGDTELDVLVTNISELISGVKFGGSLGCDDYGGFCSPEGYGPVKEYSQDFEFWESKIPALQGISR